MSLKRIFDLLLALAAAVVLAVPVLLVAVAVRVTSPGPALYWSDRVGRHNRLFKMPKFRSMRVGTPAVATHFALRTQSGVHELVPGLTGWAQVNGRDELPIPHKVKLADGLRRAFWSLCFGWYCDLPQGIISV